MARSYFIKYLASVVSLIYLPEALIWNKTTFPASNSVNLVEPVVNELMRSTSKNVLTFPFLFDLLLLTLKISRAYN